MASELALYMRSDAVRTGFAEVVGDRAAGAYISSVLLAVANDTSGNLQKCSHESIYISALRAATLSLSVDPSTGQAYIVPFKGRATLVVGYKGLHDMAVRTNKYRYINVSPIYTGEVVTENRISGFHSIEGGKAANAEIIGWLAAFELFAGYAKTMYMTVEEIHEHAARYSPSYNYDKGLWKTNPRAMERKTVLRLLLRKWGYLDPADVRMLDILDDEGDIIDGEIAPDASNRAPELPQLTEAQIMADLGFADPQPAAPSPSPAQTVAPTPAPSTAAVSVQPGERPYSPDELRERLTARAKTHTRPPTDKQIQLTAMLMRDALGGDDKRHIVTKYLTGHESLKDCGVMVNALLDWLKPVQDSGGAYTVDPLAGKELTAAYTEALKAAGQSELPL